MSKLLYHIAAAEDWEQHGATYAPTMYSIEGFIHCSTPEQLAGVARRRFRGRDDLLLLSIDPERVGAVIRYENLTGGTEQFPHIYGLLNVDAVVADQPLYVGDDGELDFSVTSPRDE